MKLVKFLRSNLPEVSFPFHNHHQQQSLGITAFTPGTHTVSFPIFPKPITDQDTSTCLGWDPNPLQRHLFTADQTGPMQNKVFCPKPQGATSSRN